MGGVPDVSRVRWVMVWMALSFHVSDGLKTVVVALVSSIVYQPLPWQISEAYVA